MLGNSLGVLARQKAKAMTRPEWKAAYEKGVRYWERHYAGLQFGQLKEAVGEGKNVMKAVKSTGRLTKLAPKTVARMIGSQVARRGRRYNPFVRRKLFFGSLRRVTPISRDFGHERGKPVDRYYVESFLSANRDAVAGRVLEIGDNSYTMRYGGSAVTESDVLNRYGGHPGTTFVGDLADGSNLPDDTFDSIVLTQTLQFLFDMPKAIATLHRILKPGGTLLVTVPWASPIDAGEWGDDWCWSVSPNALRRLLSGPFPETGVTVSHFGNVLSATAFIYGLAEDELKREELDVHDPYCPVLVAGRAKKAG
jgi:SAM-dependent methyltransferase